MGRILFDDDPLKTEWFEYDEATDTSFIHTEWKGVDTIIEENKAVQGPDVAKGKEKDMWHVGRVPLFLLEHWRITEGIDWRDPNDGLKLLAKLDDIDYRALRVNTSQIGIRKKIL